MRKNAFPHINIAIKKFKVFFVLSRLFPLAAHDPHHAPRGRCGNAPLRTGALGERRKKEYAFMLRFL